MADTIIVGLIGLGAAVYLLKICFKAFNGSPGCGCLSGSSECKGCLQESPIKNLKN